MELQWPLILFTTLTAWGCGVLGGAGALALKGAGKKSQQLLAILSCALLAAGGIAVFFHLQHRERIFNGFGHITSGITQELIAIVVFVVIAVAYFAMARKSDDGGTLPKGVAWVAIAISVILAAVCAHSYMMPARPAWDSVLEVLSIVGAACLDVYEEEGDLFYEDFSGSVIQDDKLVRLIAMPNVIVTSHQAFLTKEALDNIAHTTVENMVKFEKGIESPDTEVCYHCGRQTDCRKERHKKCF